MPHIPICSRFSIIQSLLLTAVLLPAQDVDQPLYEPTYRKHHTEPASLTAADWVGPDGIVYPRFSGVGADFDTSTWHTIDLDDGDLGQAADGDITAELRAAIAAAEEPPGGAGGTVIQIAAGTFQLSEPVAIFFDNVLIQGAGSDAGGTRIELSLPVPMTEAGSADPIGKPMIVPHLYRGAFSRYGSATVIVDPRFRYGSSTTRDAGPVSSTLQEVYLVIHDTLPDSEGDLDDPVERRIWNRGNNSNPIPTLGFDGEDFYNHRDRFDVGPGGSLTCHIDVHYSDGSVRSGDPVTIPVDYGATDYIRDHDSDGGATGFFWCVGGLRNDWSWRAHLVEPARRGDTSIRIDDLDDLVVGSTIDLTTDWYPGFKGVDDSNKNTTAIDRAERAQTFVITAIDTASKTLTLDQPLRYSIATVEHSEIQHEHPIWRFGISDIAFLQTTDHWQSFIDATDGINHLLLEDLIIDDIGRSALWLPSIKHGTVRRVRCREVRWPSTGGASGYVGGGGCNDLLYDQVSITNHRHAPNFHGGNNIVVRNSWFDMCDGQLHAGLSRDLLYENVRINADRSASGYAWTTMDWQNALNGGGNGDHVVFVDCDLQGKDGGLYFGGRQEAAIIAYNRITADDGSPVVVRGGSSDHLLYRNTLIVEDRFLPALTFGGRRDPRGQSDDDSADHNAGIEMVDNRIYGGNGLLADGIAGASDHSSLARSYGNVVLPIDQEAARPGLPSAFLTDPDTNRGSLYLTQQAHADGMTPQDGVYHPEVDAAADRLRSEGALVAQVNFSDDEDHVGGDWLLEDMDSYGERDAGWTYGWEDAIPGKRTDGYGHRNILYRTYARYSSDDHVWSIALPAGKYDVFLAIGGARYGSRSGTDTKIYDWPWDLSAYRVLDRSFALNDRTYDDTDLQQPTGHIAEEWREGVTNAGDRFDPQWISSVAVADAGDGTGKLTFRRHGSADDSGAICFIQIYEHAEQDLSSRRISIGRFAEKSWFCEPAAPSSSQTATSQHFEGLDPAVDHLLDFRPDGDS